MRNILRCVGLLLAAFLAGAPSHAQMYPDGYNYQNYQPGADWAPPAQSPYPTQGQAPGGYGREQSRPPNLQYDPRDAEAILREQTARGMGRGRGARNAPPPQQEMYDQQAYGHRIQDGDQVRAVIADARQIGALIAPKRNAKPFVVIDKRNYQFYLYDSNCKLLRIGPVAIGKGRTEVGAFETPVGVFPVKSKAAIDDWIRPDWYFIEEGEPIPQRWEDRRVPGFFRYKIVYDGARYIHYAEATGGRLTHGCLGLDWEDAEAVFHTMEVGSYCIIIDQPFIMRMAKGEFPIRQPPKPKPTQEAQPTVTAKAESSEPPRQEKTFGSMW